MKVVERLTKEQERVVTRVISPAMSFHQMDAVPTALLNHHRSGFHLGTSYFKNNCNIYIKLRFLYQYLTLGHRLKPTTSVRV